MKLTYLSAFIKTQNFILTKWIVRTKEEAMFHLPRNGDYANSLKVSIVRCVFFLGLQEFGVIK